MKAPRRRPGDGRDEDGAMAIMVALMAVVLFFAAALAVDISSLAMERQQLHDNIDAAAHAGAYELPNNGTGAMAKARAMALTQDPTLSPETDLWCIVGSTGSTKAVRTEQIPATCTPGSPPYTAASYPGLRCDTIICAIPCFPDQGDKCNSMRVSDEKIVPFGFASIGEWLLSNGVNDRREGSTGAVTTVACKGSCGNDTPNPLDVVVMADRTASMKYADREAMKVAILNMLKVMTPSMHYVSFGTLHKSRTTDYTAKANTYGPQKDDFIVNNCLTGCSVAQEKSYDSSTLRNYNGHWDGTGDTNGDGRCYTEASTKAPASTSTVIDTYTYTPTTGTPTTTSRPAPGFGTNAQIISGTWTPVPFSNNYLSTVASPTSVATLNNASALVDGISCLPQSIAAEYGTHLASAFKGGVAKLLSGETASMPARPGTPRKVLVFETDGMPDESGPSFGNTELNSGDLSAGTQTAGGPPGCNNLISVADKAKAQDITVITIAFGDAATARCRKGSTSTAYAAVRDVLANAASPDPNTGLPSTANACNTPALIEAENVDGDYFFCAADGASLSNIFTTAITQVSNGIRFVKMPPAP
ncbi:TadE/TadG family type IV pilus assembly protein [Nocardioides sp.]|uniref:TadE/TadG family type IV pilus assembly protein n=1 Tax=Nocardioides sp. TaxID=35761 RepID=UPI00263934AE|nr:TadE/TadG family type IV pilus assembly protein [Nocardioides sp.]MCW2738158.1 hypothetical protein [Nocardioides sp.]